MSERDISEVLREIVRVNDKVQQVAEVSQILDKLVDESLPLLVSLRTLSGDARDEVIAKLRVIQREVNVLRDWLRADIDARNVEGT